jgi:hypothetical protein
VENKKMLKAIPILFVLAIAAGTTEASAVPLAPTAVEGTPSLVTQVHWRGHHHHGWRRHHWHRHHHHGWRRHHWHRHHHHGWRHHYGWHRHHHHR